MKKRNIQERIKDLRSIEDLIKDEEKNPEFQFLLERARLRIAVARAIKLARMRAGLTQVELAQALHTTQSVIGRLESLKDKRLPSLDLLIRIAEATRRRLIVDQPGLHLELSAK